MDRRGDHFPPLLVSPVYQTQHNHRSAEWCYSHWSRSIKILCSDWLGSWFCYALKGSIIGAGVSQTIPPIIDSYCAFQPLILFSSTPLRQLFATLSLLNILWEESRTTSIFTSGHLTVVVNGKILHDKIDVFFENSTSTLPKSMKGKLSK